MNIREEVRRMKQDAPFAASSPEEVRNRALTLTAASLTEHADENIAENQKDLEAAKEN